MYKRVQVKKRTMKVPCVLSIQTLWENSVLTLVHMLLLYRVQPVQHIYWIDIILEFILFCNKAIDRSDKYALIV